MAEDKKKLQEKKVNIDLGNTIRKPSNKFKPITDKTLKMKDMANMRSIRS